MASLSKKQPTVIVLLALLVCSSFQLIFSRRQVEEYFKEIDHCTTIAVGRKASSTGSPMLTHNSDCFSCDFRINKVPAKDWPTGTERPIYLYRSDYPALVAQNRGTTWLPSNLEGTPTQIKNWGNESKIIDHIPQVAHTYAIYEASYGIMNEHQVALGESTCAAKLYAVPVTAGGKARIEMGEMSRIALERTKTARECIQMMGDLATTYGFYAADWSGGDASRGQGGEAITVVDKTEAWVFHVMADDTGASAIWVAERLEPDQVTIVANQFIIRKVDPHSDKFMYSKNLWEIAKKKGWWSEKNGLLDFLLTYAPQRAHAIYVTRRLWRFYNIVAPSLNLPADTDPFALNYPFSAKPDKVLSPEDLIQITRDHFEGTQFDLTKGIAAGPYGNPDRYDAAPVDGMTTMEVIQGSYERAISLFRTTYSFVAQPRADLPNQAGMFWFSQYAPSSSSYAPFFVGSKDVPPAYRKGSLFKYDNKVPFWNFLAVGNYAGRFYRHAMEDVHSLQRRLMEESITAVKKTEEIVRAIVRDPLIKSNEEKISKIVEITTETTYSQAHHIVKEWRNFFPYLITRFHDGLRAEGLDAPTIDMKQLFYPKSWLDATGYFKNKINTGPDVILFSPGPSSSANGQDPHHFTLHFHLISLAILVVATSILILLTVCYKCYEIEKTKGKGLNGINGGKDHYETIA